MPTSQLNNKRVSKPKTILVVEDEKSLREALVDILIMKDFIALQAKNGKEGADLALEKHPDLILLDIIMPEMDGMTVLKKIREDKWGEKIPVIILTNLSTTNHGQLIDDKVANRPTYYLIKSDWKLLDIVKKIEKILEM